MTFDRYEVLSQNLRNDGLFREDRHLWIIDDYNTNGLSDEGREFFARGFAYTGVEEITILYQDKNRKNGRVFHNWAVDLGVPPFQFQSFINAVLKSQKRPEDILLDLGGPGSSIRRMMEEAVRSAELFIREMRSYGITVRYQMYNPFRIKPPFHGRYWINRCGGYIVDGSLSTYNKAAIFAQRMDQVNHSIILGMLDDKIFNVLPPQSSLGRGDFDDIFNRLLDERGRLNIG